MAKAKRRSRIRRIYSRVKSRAQKMTIPVSIVAGLMPGFSAVITSTASGGWQAAGRTAGLIYTGYDYTTNKWSLRNMQLGLMPLFFGVMVHKVAGLLGVNRAIARTGIPLIRI